MPSNSSRKSWMVLTALTILALLLASCQSAAPAVTEAPTQPPPPTVAPTTPVLDVAAMQNIRWVLAAYGDPNNPTVPPRTIQISALFDDQGNLSGSGGCNSYSTTYTAASDGTLTVNPVLATTMMACEQDLMDAEAAFLQALSMAQSFTYLADGSLAITYGYSGVEDTGLLVFTKGQVPLVNTQWVLLSYGDPNSPTAVQLGLPITALFGEDLSLTGSAGCNSYMTGYTVDGETLTIDMPASTMMMCPSGMEQEAAYLAALPGAQTYQIVGQMLTINTTVDGTATVLNFTSASLPLVGTLWTLAAWDGVPVDATAPITAVFQPGEEANAGTVGGTGGCNNYNAPYTVDGANLTIGAAASTMMACEEPLMDAEMQYLQALQSAQTYEILGGALDIVTGAGTLTFAAGRTPLTGALWQLTSLGDVENPVSPVAGANFTAQFMRNPASEAATGVLSGTTGCNEYAAAYAASVTGMKINLPESTGSATCAPGLSDQEQLYFLALNNVTTYRILGETLVMPYDDGKQALVFHATQLGVAERPPLTELDGSYWYLWSINDTPVVNGTTITAQLSVDEAGQTGQMNGTAGCNNYNAAFGQGLGIQTTLTSGQFCAQPQGVMDQESNYMSTLSRGYGYWQTGDQFIMNTGSGTLTYKSSPPPASSDQTHLLVNRDWFLVSFNTSLSSPGTQEPFLRFNPDGTLNGFTGCNTVNGSYATNLTQLTFSQVASTKAACTSPALQTQEQALLAMMAVPQTYQVFDTSMQISGTTGVFNFSITPLTRPDEVAIPVAIIKAPADARVNTPVTFDGSASTSELPLVRYSWDFGDGGRATGAVVQHVYSQTGTYRVLLSVFDQANQGNTGSTQITIWQEVTPTVQPTKPVPPTGTPVGPEPTRTVEPTVPPTGTPAPDQPTAVPPTETPTPLPPTEEPTPPPSVPPTAAVNGPSTGFIGEPVSFSAAGSTAGSSPIVSYSWDFGDGGRSSAGPDVSYLYNHSGSYTVNVIVTDQAGLSSNASLQINIDARLDTAVWTLSNVNPGTAITLQFLNGQIAGFAGCNTYTGSYSATDNGDGTYTVTPSGFNVSRLSCPQSIMDQENAYLSSLQQITTASVQGSMLSLTGGGGPLTYYEVGSPQPR